jgi:diacylglycerol kinase
MLLAENFIEVQMGKSKREAFRVTIQTLVMAVAAALVMGLDGVQKWVLLNPELFLVIVAGFNIYIGKYVGLRALEYVKFKDLTRKK